MGLCIVWISLFVINWVITFRILLINTENQRLIRLLFNLIWFKVICLHLIVTRQFRLKLSWKKLVCAVMKLGLFIRLMRFRRFMRYHFIITQIKLSVKLTLLKVFLFLRKKLNNWHMQNHQNDNLLITLYKSRNVWYSSA